MSTSENRAEGRPGGSREGLSADFAQNQKEFEYRLNRAEWKAVGRTGAWVVLLVASGLGLLLYSVQEARKARLEAERSREAAINYREQSQRYETQIGELEAALSNSREAIQYVSQGINSYHAGNYGAAVRAYDDALRLDPRNAYVLNLKGYSLFKMKDFKGAISALRDSVAANPEYAWGYFDLARAYCAVQKYDLASQGIQQALRLRPELKQSMSRDAEFVRLCAPVKQIFSQSPPAPHEPDRGKISPSSPTPHPAAPPGPTVRETESGCQVSFGLRRESGAIPPDLRGRVEDALFKRVCDLAKANFKVGEAPVTLEIKFEIGEDGSVANCSIQRSSGNSQFDNAVRKTVQESRFPLADPFKSGTAVQVVIEVSYSSKLDGQVSPRE